MIARSVTLTAPRGPIEIREQETGIPGRGEVLVRMQACGICHSDIFVAGLEKVQTPLILGHEGIGRVELVGEDAGSIAPGERVGITFLGTTCGECPLCLSGRERYCVRQRNCGYTLQGALASYAIVPAQHLVRIPEQLDARDAAPLCCAGWTAYRAVRESGLESGQTVALFGMGGLGHLAVQYGRLRGLKIAAVDPDEEKLRLAAALGADTTIAHEEAGRAIQKIGGADAAIVLTAAPAAIAQAFRSLKRGCRLVLVGLSKSNFELPIVDTVLKGIEIRGSYLGAKQDLEEVLQLAVHGKVRCHTETYPVEHAPELLEKLRAGGILGRAVISFC